MAGIGNWITPGDFTELAIKFRQRGLPFLLSKLSFRAKDRTLSAFAPEFQHANWWIIPRVKQRFNRLATGNPEEGYEAYISRKYLSDNAGLLISPGCGTGGHERLLGALNPHWSILGCDLSPALIDEATVTTQESGPANVSFQSGDFTQMQWAPQSVDAFHFYASLHHFREIELLLTQRLLPALKPGGLIIVHEYVGPDRMLFPSHQLEAAAKALHRIPRSARSILGTPWTKNRIYAHGSIRMILSDPTECVDSASILPSLHQHMRVLEEKPLGGNLLMPVLKHIAHHFIEGNEDVLTDLFHAEDVYLQSHPSDFIFGVYQKR